MNCHQRFVPKEWHPDPAKDEYMFQLRLDNFLSDLSAEPLIENFIDRKSPKIPDTFVPSARGIVTFHQFLLELVDRKALRYLWFDRRPRGWVGKCREGKVWCSPSFRCTVSVCRYDKLWAIGREMERDGQYVHEVLCFAFGPTPIFHHRYKWAVTLAHHCHPNLRDELQWLRWVPIAT
jgi:hypothetical protein